MRSQRRAQRGRSGEQRTLHLVDLGSLVMGSASTDFGRVTTETIQAYRSAIPLRPLDDSALIGLDAEIFDPIPTTSGVHVRGRFFIRWLATDAVLSYCECAALYDRVSVATADIRFVPVVRELELHGTPVMVVSTERAVCRLVSHVASEVVLLPTQAERCRA